MGSTILAFEAHDDKILEVGDTGLAHFHLSGNFTGMAGDLKDDRFLFHEVVLFEGFGEVYFRSDSFGLHLLNFLLRVFFIIPHGDQFL